MSANEARALAAALAAEVNAKQGTDYEVKEDALLARKKAEGTRPAALVVKRPAADASDAASALAAKVAAKLKDKTGVLTVLAPRAPRPADVEAWSAAAAEIVALLEKAGVKTGSDLMTLDEPPEGSPFDYASWIPQAKGGLLVDVFYRAGGGASKAKNADADHWLVLVGEPAPSGKAVGRAFGIDLEGDAVSRAWWAEPKGAGFSFRRF